MVFAPNVDHTDRLRFLAKEDFYQNYFLSRTQGKDIDGNAMTPYTWNGDRGSCDEGSIDLDVQNKVANRINYFRRNAGVPEVLFDAATNEYCQKAALMMMANGKLEHNPPRTWRCWSSEGAYAAKHSLIIKDANTSMAVTYIMDDKNPSAGNRRWLLYPNGKVYGHGSTNEIAVIWALDDSGSTDTTQYMDAPVCWPPEGHVPQMMMFSNWTFSIYRDLKDAKVEVMQDGKAIPVVVEKYVEGYGAPTLVFKPQVNKNALPDKSNFDVSVTLSDGRNYKYTVRSFNYNPGR
ncbi:MAG: CAP domain-containing protein, partial [Bacteroidia bacterium]